MDSMNSLERSKRLLASLHEEVEGSNDLRVLDPRPTPGGDTLLPLDDHIILVQDRAPEVMGKVILSADSAKKARPCRGRILAVGPGLLAPDLKYRRPLDCFPGDVVYFYPHRAQYVVHDGQELVVLKEADVMAKVGHGKEA